MSAVPGDITALLQKWSQGDKAAIDQLTPVIYTELRRLAHQYMRRERTGHTLQSTELVHEAYFRLVDQKQAKWHDRTHFFAISSQIMRRILVDHARAHLREKRGGGALTLVINEAIDYPERRGVELAALDDALHGLARLDPQQCRVVELRFFTGLSIEETKKQALAGLPDIFGSGREQLRQQSGLEKDELYKQIGQLKVELDFLKKRSGLLA